MQEVFEKIMDRLAWQRSKNRYESHNDEWNVGIDQAEQIVNEVAAEYNDGWIPCSERIPEGKEWEFTDADGDTFHKQVLCQTKDSDVPMVVGFYQEGVWFTADTYDTINVIAWQPLPQPYEPKEV